MPVIRRTAQKGSALVYILIAIALLAALTATFMGSSGSQTSSQKTFDVVTELNAQINFIRSAIQECVLTYPSGDSTMPVAPAAVGGTIVTRPYPLQANNTYLASPAANAYAENIRCPGNPGNSNNHAKIFGGNSGKFFPPKPALFNNWHYGNGPDGVFLFINISNKSDAYLDTALQKLDAQYSKCEVQYINNTTGAAIQTMSNPALGYACNSAHKCLIVHLVTTGTTLYPGETGCP